MSATGTRPRGFARGACAAALLLGLSLTGCFSFHREAPRPGRTTVGSKSVGVPAETYGNFLIVETKWDKYGPYHFLIDTGSSSTLLTPELVARYGETNFPVAEPEVRVKSASGAATVLKPAVVRQLRLGKVVFEDVPVLVYDCASLSSVLGVKIDGILGFPLFRETILTLDYPKSRVILEGTTGPRKLIPGRTVAFNNSSKTPLIPVRLSDRTFIALIDSGSDATLGINPVGFDPKLIYASGPTEGPTETTLTGDHQDQLVRLGEDLYVGDYLVSRPVAQLTDELSFIGGGILKHFTVTFDQEHDQVTFHREASEPVTTPPWRGAGISFAKSPAYWKVVGVVPGSPADAADVQQGDLVTKINGEPVETWDYLRFAALLANTDAAVFTFLNGTQETTKRISFVDLVP